MRTRASHQPQRPRLAHASKGWLAMRIGSGSWAHCSGASQEYTGIAGKKRTRTWTFCNFLSYNEKRRSGTLVCFHFPPPFFIRQTKDRHIVIVVLFPWGHKEENLGFRFNDFVRLIMGCLLERFSGTLNQTQMFFVYVCIRGHFLLRFWGLSRDIWGCIIVNLVLERLRKPTFNRCSNSG